MPLPQKRGTTMGTARINRPKDRKSTITQAREQLAELCDLAAQDREPIHITRRGAEDMVLLPVHEYNGLLEKIYLLKSPANAERLLDAIEASKRGEGLIIPDLDAFLAEMQSRLTR